MLGKLSLWAIVAPRLPRNLHLIASFSSLSVWFGSTFFMWEAFFKCLTLGVLDCRFSVNRWGSPDGCFSGTPSFSRELLIFPGEGGVRWVWRRTEDGKGMWFHSWMLLLGIGQFSVQIIASLPVFSLTIYPSAGGLWIQRILLLNFSKEWRP